MLKQKKIQADNKNHFCHAKRYNSQRAWKRWVEI
jgi:hypothetical protein